MLKLIHVGVICAAFFATESYSHAQVPGTKFAIKSDKTKFIPCRLMKVTADGGGKSVLWRIDGELQDTEIDGKTVRFVVSPKATVVIIKAYTASAEGDVIEAILTLEPESTPIPPNPIPVPPSPNVDPLTDEIRKLIKPEDKQDLKKLAALYELIAKECLVSSNKTASEINILYKQAATNLVGDKLKSVREKLGVEIMNGCPDDPDSLLTDPERQKLNTVFLKLQKCCLEV